MLKEFIHQSKRTYIFNNFSTDNSA